MTSYKLTLRIFCVCKHTVTSYRKMFFIGVDRVGHVVASNMADMEDSETRGVTFKKLNLNDWLVQQLQSIGVKNPSPIQCHCIPPILNGRDCIGCAKTGSGKTFAFALPILQKFCQDPYGIYCLVLTPTRELAFQIADQFGVLGKPIGLRVSVIVGGMDMVVQGQDLANKPHVVVATPGRLKDHLTSCNTFSLKQIKFLVLDEADRLLEGQFDEQLKVIFESVPEQRQTLLFSATISDTITELKQVATNKPFFWESPSVAVTVDQLDQRYVLVPLDVKDGYLVEIICKYRETHKETSIVVFTNTCKSCQIMAMMLRELGFDCVALHSMISQRERLAALSKFKSNIVRILLATDVASRGLDIPQVDLVINHHVPTIPKDYVHRVGRTARAGRDGMAISMVTQHDIHLIHAIEDLIKVKLKQHEVDEEEVLKLLTQVAVAKKESEIRLDETDFGEKKKINKRKQLILDGKDPDYVEKQMQKRMKHKRRRKT